MNHLNSTWLLQRAETGGSPWIERLKGLGIEPRIFSRSEPIIELLEAEAPEAVLVAIGPNPKAETESLYLLGSQCMRRSVPLIGLTDAILEPAWLATFDDWVIEGSLPELPTRILTAKERLSLGGSSGVGARFLSMLVHDLRTPLNVISLTHRVIEQCLSRGDFEIGEDMGYIRDNATQIERMLALVSDYCSLLEPQSAPALSPVDPRRYMEDLLEDKYWQRNFRTVTNKLEVEPSCPDSVWIDPTRARLALVHALGNAASTANGTPILVNVGADDEHLTVTIKVERAPLRHIESMEIDPASYVRLRGTTTERRGFDLAMASRILRQFGGSVELKVVPEKHSSIILRWPLVRESVNGNGNGH